MAPAVTLKVAPTPPVRSNYSRPRSALLFKKLVTQFRVFFFLLAGPLSFAAWAQTGVVKSGNQTIPGATVTATAQGQTFSTVTDADGRFHLSGTLTGDVKIEVKMFGFEPLSKIVPADTTSVEFSLKVQPSPILRRLAQGGAASTPEPNLQNEPTPPAQAEPASSNEAFLVAGSISQGLAPNATPDGGDSAFRFDVRPGGFDAGADGAGPSGPGGGRGGFGGGAFGGPGGPGGFGGRGGGPGQRGPGGNRPGAGRQFGNRRGPSGIRGMISFSLNNSIWNARPYSLTGASTHQPAYATGRLNVLLGGPLVIGKIKDSSTFFTLTYTGGRGRNPFTSFVTVPSLLERAGDFSQTVQTTGPVQVYDPITHQPLPGNRIPANRLDAIAIKLLNYVPLPNAAGRVNNYSYYSAVASNNNNVGLRLQRNVTKKDRLAFNMNLQFRDGTNGQPYGFIDSSNGFGANVTLTWTRNISARLIHNLHGNFNRNRNEISPFFSLGPNIAAQLGILGTSNNPVNNGPPNLNFTNFGPLSDGVPTLIRNQSQSIGDGLTWVVGKHSVTFGVDYRRNDLSTRSDPNGRGTFNFTGQSTSALDANGRPIPNSGFDLADLLYGLPQSASIRYGDTSTYFTQNVWTGFVSDDFKVHPRLTLTTGLRYEYFEPLTEKQGHLANLDIAAGFASVAVVTPGQRGPFSGSFSDGLINPDRNNVAPRFGFAWKVPKIKRSTLVRGGYGIYYNGQTYNGFAAKLAQQPPFATSSNVNTSPTKPLSIASGLLATSPADVTNTFAVDRHYRTPYAQTWTLSVQHDFSRGFFVELGYLGTKGTRLDIQTLPNTSPVLTLAQRNQLGNATGFTFDQSNGDSIYHALQVRANRRFARGLSFGAFYTYSKSIDNSTSFGGAGNTVAQNWLNLAAERGLSSFDRRHSFDINWVYTSPIGGPASHLNTGPLTTKLLKDWTLNGSLTAQSGTPLTARVLGNNAQLAQTGGVGSGRADATGQPLYAGNGFFNPAAFAVPQAGTYGNAGRNTIAGPGSVVLNLSVGRSITLGETRRRLELRMEANNLLNHVNYASFGTVVNSLNYGVATSVGNMRMMNAVVRLRF